MKAKFPLSLLCAGCLLHGASSFAVHPVADGKNVLDVRFTHLPAETQTLLAEESGHWNFNFRPYGSSAGLLWSDPAIQRNAANGDAGDQRMTGLDVVCDENGFSLLLLCYEPGLATCYGSTNSFPTPNIEFFFAPGDADTPKVEHYYQMYYGGTKLNEFPWLVDNRGFRPCLPFTTHSETVVKDAILVRFDFSWQPLFDRLPVIAGKADNFWRLSVIRWAPGGGQTWGGTVHQANQAGYIRFPEFTREQRTAILSGLLKKAWIDFRAKAGRGDLKTASDWSGVPLRNEAFIAEENAAAPRSYVNFNEDPGFRPVLEKLVAERNALSPAIGRFAELPDDEQLAFYRKASQMLFNFEYDVQEAYARYQQDRVFSMK